MKRGVVYKAIFSGTQQPSTKRPNQITKGAGPATQQSVTVVNPKKK